MSLYAWTALNSDGELARGRSQAADEKGLEQQLREQHLELLRLRDISWQHQWHLRIHFGRRERLLLCIELQQLTGAGIPLLDALAGMRDSADKEATRGLLSALVDDLHHGASLAEALERQSPAFDSIAIALIRAGERSGTLQGVLQQLISTLRWQDEFFSELKRSLFYPLLLFSAVLAVSIFLLCYLVPALMVFLQGQGHAPGNSARLLMWLSTFLRGGGVSLIPPAILTALLVLLAWHLALRDWIERRVLRLWLVGPLLRSALLARFSRVFALLYGAGIPVLDALRQCEPLLHNRRLAQSLRQARLGVGQGASLAAACAVCPLFPPLFLRLLHSGERSGALEQSLHELANIYERELREHLHRLQTLLEPALTLVAGGMLAWIMLAVLGPVYETIGGRLP